MVFALFNSVTPATPYEWFGTVFAVVILGGVGNLLGTLVAGIGIGVLSGVVSVVWSPSTEPFVLFLAIILALLLRPQGLFARASPE
jgi:branched-chain amino acid transport system permease protein